SLQDERVPVRGQADRTRVGGPDGGDAEARCQGRGGADLVTAIGNPDEVGRLAAIDGVVEPARRRADAGRAEEDRRTTGRRRPGRQGGRPREHRYRHRREPPHNALLHSLITSSTAAASWEVPP